VSAWDSHFLCSVASELDNSELYFAVLDLLSANLGVSTFCEQVQDLAGGKGVSMTGLRFWRRISLTLKGHLSTSCQFQHLAESFDIRHGPSQTKIGHSVFLYRISNSNRSLCFFLNTFDSSFCVLRQFERLHGGNSKDCPVKCRAFREPGILFSRTAMVNIPVSSRYRTGLRPRSGFHLGNYCALDPNARGKCPTA
jgi:hypothetical protein